MIDRIRLNTTNLKEKFPEVYKEMFSESSLVVSVPCCIYLSGFKNVINGIPALIQKLPTRVYVGLAFSDDKKIKFESFRYFDLEKQMFLDREFDSLTTNQVADYFNKNFDNIGCNIQVIMELPTSLGANTTSSEIIALIAALYFLKNKLSITDIQNFKKSQIKINEIIEHYNNIEKIINKKNQDCGSVVSSLINSNFPIVFQEKNDKYNYCQLDFQNNKEKTNSLTWPISFGMMYVKGSASIIDVSENIFERSKEIINSIENNDLFKDFYKDLEQDLDVKYIELNKLLSLELTYNFQKTLIDKKNILNLIESFNRYRYVQYLLGYYSNNLVKISEIMIQEVKQINENIDIGINFVETVKEGTLLFVIPHNSFRYLKDDLFKNIESKIGKKLYFPYLSWEDGYETEGIRVEQYIEKGIYSKFISKGAISIREYDYNNSKTIILTKDQFEIEKNEIDLFLDLKNKDIYIKGNKLTSRDIHSSSATIEILKILLKKKGKNVINKELPDSSYTLERGELQSKIVTPLVKAVKKYADKELDLKITGSLTSFEVCLNIADLKVNVLEKIL